MENEIMKFEEVMEFLNIGKNTLYILLNSGEIQAFRIGRVWKIPENQLRLILREKLEKMIEKKRSISNTPPFL